MSAKVGNPFCVGHYCNRTALAESGCCRVCPASSTPPRVMFAHIEKTGGSSIECATVEHEQAGLWMNMGHTKVEYVKGCRKACGWSPLLIGLRNPYDYCACTHASIASVCALLTGPRLRPCRRVGVSLCARRQAFGMCSGAPQPALQRIGADAHVGLWVLPRVGGGGEGRLCAVVAAAAHLRQPVRVRSRSVPRAAPHLMERMRVQTRPLWT